MTVFTKYFILTEKIPGINTLHVSLTYVLKTYNMQRFITSESLSSDFFSLSWSDPRKNFRAATITWKVELYIKNMLVQFRCSMVNPLAYTDGCQTAGLSRSIFTQPAVRRSEPSMSFLLILAFCQ